MIEPSSQRWFYAAEGGRKGPVTRDALVDLLLGGTLSESTLVWCSSLSDWRPASEVPELRREFPPPLPPFASGMEAREAFEASAPPDAAPNPESLTDPEAELLLPPDAPEEAAAPSEAADAPGSRAERQRRHRRRRHRARQEDRYVVVPRDQRRVMLWAWPLLLLAGLLVWLVLLRANREEVRPPQPQSLLSGTATRA